MATLREYYELDFSPTSIGHDWKLRRKNGQVISITSRVYFDFDSNAQFISYYVPECDNPMSVFAELILAVPDVLRPPLYVDFDHVLPGDRRPFSSEDVIFCGQIFFYFDGLIDANEFEKLYTHCKPKGVFIHCRDHYYVEERSKAELPLAFVSHDSLITTLKDSAEYSETGFFNKFAMSLSKS